MGQEMSIMGQELISAVKDKNNEKVSYLVENMDSCEINKVGEDGDAALHEACMGHNHEAVDILLAKGGIEVNVKGNYDWTPLHMACRLNKPQAVRKLLARSDVNARHILGSTPIMYAAGHCHEKILKLMLGDPRVNLDIRNGWSLEELVGRWCSEEGKKQKYFKMIKEEELKRESRQAGQQRTSQDGQIGGCAGKTDNVEVSEKEGEETGVETENAGSSASPNVDNDVSLCWSCWRDGQMYKCGACKRVTAYCSRECLQKDWPVHNDWCWFNIQ